MVSNTFRKICNGPEPLRPLFDLVVIDAVWPSARRLLGALLGDFVRYLVFCFFVFVVPTARVSLSSATVLPIFAAGALSCARL